MSNPWKNYLQNFRDNLPTGVTYREDIARYVFNDKRFILPNDALRYKNYLEKLGFVSDLFSPLSLFASGEQGVWYDPSDLSTMFTDTAGTTPATVGSAVGLLLDKSQGLELGPELVTKAGVGEASDWDGLTEEVFIAENNRVTINISENRWTALIGFGTLKAGKSYEIKVSISVADAGSFNIQTVNTSQNAIISPLSISDIPVAVGVHSYIASNLSADGYLRIRSNIGSTFTIDNISIRELAGNHATQATAAQRPTYQTTPDRLVYDGVDDNTVTDFGAAFAGDVFQGTVNGILHYAISTAGTWQNPISPPFRPDDGTVTTTIAREGSLPAGDVAKVKTYLQEETGSGADFAGVTDMSDWFRDRTDVTTIYSGNWDTSSVTSFSNFALDCSNLTALDVSNWDTSSVTSFNRFAVRCSSLTTLDVSNWDTSSVTDFAFFAFGCSSLTTVTVNGGTGNPFADSPCTNYSSAFSGTNLTQASIDDILVAVESAGTSGGTFVQSGGSAPSATGEAAVTALRGRGWTVTVTGGF